MDAKSFPQNMSSLRVLYLQEFLMEGANPICNLNGYQDKIFKVFPDLLSLDGVRKSTPMN